MVYSFDMLLQGESSRAFARDMRRVSPLGSVYWETGISPQSSLQIIDMLRRLKTPVAVLAESWAGRPLAGGPQKAPLAWFSLGNASEDGEKMGRFLHDLGHRHLAFISTDHREGDGHSFLRWQGLLEVFGSDRPDSSVELYPIDLGDDGIHDLTFANAARQAADLLYSPPSGPETDDLRELRRASQEFLGMARTSLTTITERVGLKETLDRALTRKRITCWVGDNDVTALACLGHLNRNGLRVPQDISVAGFDDGLRSLMAGMTSYNFGGAEMMRAIMTFITRPHQRRPDKAVTVAGRVVPRATTASPRT
jgi:DNA-binding LacI/PurR family transcriptional regulator